MGLGLLIQIIIAEQAADQITPAACKSVIKSACCSPHTI